MEKIPEKVNQQLSVFGLPAGNLAAQLQQIRSQFLPYLQLWTAIFDFQTMTSQWWHAPFTAVDAGEVERLMGQWLSLAKYVAIQKY